MDLNVAKKYIQKEFENLGIELEYEQTDKKLTAKGNLTKDGLGDFLFVMTVYQSKLNTVGFSMYFNEIEPTPEVYKLLNEFNKNAYILYACEDEFLILEHTAKRVKEEEVGAYAIDILDELDDDEVFSLLKPLIDLTF